MLMLHHHAQTFINDYPDLEMEAQRLQGSDVWLIIIDQDEIPEAAQSFIDAHATYQCPRQLELPLETS